MKPISKSKRQLAQLLIEAGVKTFPDGREYAVQDGRERRVGFFTEKPIWQHGLGVWGYTGDLIRVPSVELSVLVKNWHQTVLSRDEFDQIVAESEPQFCESVTRTIPEPVTAPTLDQLLQDYRNAADFATRKQAEADEAAKMRDERWKAAQARACELGVHISVELVVDATMRESEPVITDWRDLRVGDEVECVKVNKDGDNYADEYIGKVGSVIKTEPPMAANQAVKLRFCDGKEYWINEWRFIRRP